MCVGGCSHQTSPPFCPLKASPGASPICTVVAGPRQHSPPPRLEEAEAESLGTPATHPPRGEATTAAPGHSRAWERGGRGRTQAPKASTCAGPGEGRRAATITALAAQWHTSGEAGTEKEEEEIKLCTERTPACDKEPSRVGKCLLFCE